MTEPNVAALAGVLKSCPFCGRTASTFDGGSLLNPKPWIVCYGRNDEGVRVHERVAMSLPSWNTRARPGPTDAARIEERWPPDAAFPENADVTTQRKPFFVGRVCGWYRNADGRLGYAVEAEAIPGLIHVYPAHALAAIRALPAPPAIPDGDA